MSSGSDHNKNKAVIVEGSLDEFYQKNFRDQLEADLRSNPNKDNGFCSPDDAKRMKVLNWKKTVKIK